MFLLLNGDMSSVPDKIKKNHKLGTLFSRFGDKKVGKQVTMSIQDDFLSDFRIS